MRKFILMLLVCPAFLAAQDYTIFGTERESSTEIQGANTVLVVPLHPYNIISEIDRMITTEGQEPQQMREKLRKRISMEITRSLSDSLDALDISIASEDDEIELVDFVFNSLDYHYAEFEEREDDEEKKFKIPFPKKKKKEEKVYGAYSEKRNGQLDRVEVDFDRYMTAEFGNPGAVDYLQDIHAFEYLLVLTQIELRRNLEMEESELPYMAVLHYEFMDDSGKQMQGGKVTSFLSREQLYAGDLFQITLPGLSSQITEELWKEIYTSDEKVVQSSKDIRDY